MKAKDKESAASARKVFQVGLGDILEFPMNHESKPTLTGRYSVMMSQGVPGKFRVTTMHPNGDIGLGRIEE